jgi:restriction system protein
MGRRPKKIDLIIVKFIVFIVISPFYIIYYIIRYFSEKQEYIARERADKEECRARERANKEECRAIQLANIDSMAGVEFEKYLKKLLTYRGYSVMRTPGSGDFGVDLVASRNGDTIAIQVKRSESQISRRAISDAVGGMKHYSCNKAMVITNNHFTKGADTLARSNGCILIDRIELARWIIEFKEQSAILKS